jgi:hypothetical protein
LYPHVTISDSRHDVVSVSGSTNSYEWNRAGGTAHLPIAQRPLNHRKHPRYKCIVSRLSYAMLSGLSEISLCTYRSFDSTNADLDPWEAVFKSLAAGVGVVRDMTAAMCLPLILNSIQSRYFDDEGGTAVVCFGEIWDRWQRGEGLNRSAVSSTRVPARAFLT